jgi:hypothetical protein
VINDRWRKAATSITQQNRHVSSIKFDEIEMMVAIKVAGDDAGWTKKSVN